MAKWRYDITGAEPIVRDMPVYDAATLVYGEYVMKGTTDPDSGNHFFTEGYPRCLKRRDLSVHEKKNSFGSSTIK